MNIITKYLCIISKYVILNLGSNSLKASKARNCKYAQVIVISYVHTTVIVLLSCSFEQLSCARSTYGQSCARDIYNDARGMFTRISVDMVQLLSFDANKPP